MDSLALNFSARPNRLVHVPFCPAWSRRTPGRGRRIAPRGPRSAFHAIGKSPMGLRALRCPMDASQRRPIGRRGPWEIPKGAATPPAAMGTYDAAGSGSGDGARSSSSVRPGRRDEGFTREASSSWPAATNKPMRKWVVARKAAS